MAILFQGREPLVQLLQLELGTQIDRTHLVAFAAQPFELAARPLLALGVDVAGFWQFGRLAESFGGAGQGRGQGGGGGFAGSFRT